MNNPYKYVDRDGNIPDMGDGGPKNGRGGAATIPQLLIGSTQPKITVNGKTIYVKDASKAEISLYFGGRNIGNYATQEINDITRDWPTIQKNFVIQLRSEARQQAYSTGTGTTGSNGTTKPKGNPNPPAPDIECPFGDPELTKKYKELYNFYINDAYWIVPDALSSVKYNKAKAEHKKYIAAAAQVLSEAKEALSYTLWEVNVLSPRLNQDAKSINVSDRLNSQYELSVFALMRDMKDHIINEKGNYKRTSMTVSSNGAYDRSLAGEFMSVPRILHTKHQMYKALNNSMYKTWVPISAFIAKNKELYLVLCSLGYLMFKGLKTAYSNYKEANSSGNNLEGYYQDVNGRWHRENGEFASNAEVGLSPANSGGVSSGTNANSLNYQGTNYGYRLVDKNTGKVLKYGETTNPTGRYTKSYLNENNARMEIMISGSKNDIHIWQHNQIVDYTRINGVSPFLNKSDW